MTELLVRQQVAFRQLFKRRRRKAQLLLSIDWCLLADNAGNLASSG